MFQKGKTQFKFKTYKSDAAPFFFFIDVFPLEPNRFDQPLFSFLSHQLESNPIMPLPMRVDRVFNGDYSIIIRPSEPITFPLSESELAIINPEPFLQFGLERLIYFTEIRSRETLFRSLKKSAVDQWWDTTRYLYGNLPQLEEDFSAFLRAYLYTVFKAWVNGDDIVGAATEYCTIINNICRDRMVRNSILVDVNKKQEQVKLFKEKQKKYREMFKIHKRTEYHPEIIDIEVFILLEKDIEDPEISVTSVKENRGNYKVDVLKYIPLLLYDDLQECMLQNLKLLEINEREMLDPAILLDSNVILIKKSDELLKNEINENYNWLNNLTKGFITSIFNSLTTSLNKLSEKEYNKELLREY